MADYSRERSELEDEIRKLSRQRLQVTEDATFLGGWSAEREARHVDLNKQIEELRNRLASLDTLRRGVSGS
jgi:chromosome segregation ATPase